MNVSRCSEDSEPQLRRDWATLSRTLPDPSLHVFLVNEKNAAHPTVNKGCCSRRLKRWSQPRNWELCFLWWGFWEIQVWETGSQVTLRDLFQEWGWGWGRSQVIQKLAAGASSLNIKRWLWINQVSQVKEFSLAFLHMGRSQSLGLLNWFLSFASHYLGPAYCDFIIHILNSLLTTGSESSRHQQGCWVAGSSSGAQKFTSGGPESRMAVTSLFIDTGGNSPSHSQRAITLQPPRQWAPREPGWKQEACI